MARDFAYSRQPLASPPKKKDTALPCLSFLVDLIGIEPTTLRMRTVRSPS